MWGAGPSQDRVLRRCIPGGSHISTRRGVAMCEGKGFKVSISPLGGSDKRRPAEFAYAKVVTEHFR